MATTTGTQRRAAAILSCWSNTANFRNAKNRAAIMPPISGEMTQLAAILPMVGQLTAPNPVAAIPAPMTPPTMEWVVDTGAPI